MRVLISAFRLNQLIEASDLIFEPHPGIEKRKQGTIKFTVQRLPDGMANLYYEGIKPSFVRGRS